MSSGGNQNFTKTDIQKCEHQKIQEIYASIAWQSKGVHQSIQRKVNQLEKSINNSADLGIESKSFCGTKSIRGSWFFWIVQVFAKG